MSRLSLAHRNQGWTVAQLGTAQTLAWASSYYLPAMIAAPMARDLGVSTPTVFAAFSAALVVSALLGPRAGRAIDNWGGRPVLAGTSLVFAAGLTALALATGPIGLFAGWLIMGVGMGSGLYEAAFAALVRLHGANSRAAITGITLLAGFASTVGWPLTSLLEAQFGWRAACLTWAGLHLVLGLPLNWTLPKAVVDRPAAASVAAAAEADAPSPDPGLGTPSHATRSTTALLAYVFAATWFISTAMAAHLPRLLEMTGATLAVAVAAGALVGPAQVGARLLEYGLLRKVHPLYSAGLAALAHPLGAAALLLAGAPAAVFAILHGAGNGILTIAKGTLPLVLFGPQGYGHRQGLLTVPARMAQAVAPYLFGVCLDRWGADALWLSASISVSAFVALLLIPRPTRSGPRKP
jgi:predicted MFS family arabinose efflux permease